MTDNISNIAFAHQSGSHAVVRVVPMGSSLRGSGVKVFGGFLSP